MIFLTRRARCWRWQVGNGIAISAEGTYPAPRRGAAESCWTLNILDAGPYSILKAGPSTLHRVQDDAAIKAWRQAGYAEGLDVEVVTQVRHPLPTRPFLWILNCEREESALN